MSFGVRWFLVQELVDALARCDPSSLALALDVVLRLLSNVVELHPGDAKYERALRSGKVYGAVLGCGETEKILTTIGGWKVEGDYIVSTDLVKAKNALRLVKEALFPEVAFHVEMRDSAHTVVHTLQYETRRWPLNMLVHVYVDERLQPAARERDWPGLGLWASHEAIDRSTQLCEILYLMDPPSRRLVLQAENHACQYRAIPPHIVKAPKPARCLDCDAEMPQVDAPGKPVAPRLMCFHSGLCNMCAATSTRCPICFKPKKARVGYKKN